MQKAQIGLIGLGVMGANLALNIAEKGFRIAVYNRTSEKTDAFVAEAGELAENIIGCSSLEELANAIEKPRPIILMVQAGEAVDQQIGALQGIIDADDIIIDAGNANFRDTRRRMKALRESGPRFIGMGVSGGEEGARHGPSIMVGGPREAYDHIKPVLQAIAARYEGEACEAWLGSDGAGHFVKTIHNGIEYADMQMIAEIYGIMRDGAGMAPAEIGNVFDRWNKGRLNSYLIEITAKVLGVTDEKSGGPIVDIIVDRAGQKGTGRWSAIESQSLGIPATAIEAAVAARSLSAMKDLRIEAEKRFKIETGSIEPLDDHRITMLEDALLAGKVIAYAQGFAVMTAASKEFGWDLPLAEVARIWRAGCIIRSQFLDEIASAYEAETEKTDLLMTDTFADLISRTQGALRKTVAESAAAGLPVPALASALGHFDQFRLGRGTANLIQAQRDFFGAHSFERFDAPGAHHGNWS